MRPCLVRIIYVRMTLEEFHKSLNSEACEKSYIATWMVRREGAGGGSDVAITSHAC